jgi:hypothetical protein
VSLGSLTVWEGPAVNLHAIDSSFPDDFSLFLSVHIHFNVYNILKIFAKATLFLTIVY